MTSFIAVMYRMTMLITSSSRCAVLRSSRTIGNEIKKRGHLRRPAELSRGFRGIAQQRIDLGGVKIPRIDVNAHLARRDLFLTAFVDGRYPHDLVRARTGPDETNA